MEYFELIPRTTAYPQWIIYLLFLSVGMLAFIRYKHEIAYYNIGQALLKSPTTVGFTKAEAGVWGWINWVFIFNYLVAASVVCYMLLVYKNITDYRLIGVPVVFYFFQLFSMIFIGWISGEAKRMKEFILLSNLIYHILGLVLTPLLFIWILNPYLSEWMVFGVVGLFLVVFFYKILRGILLAIRNKTLWYYIILYLCGLEIWYIILFLMVLLPYFIE